jgi:hypothetical protein
LIIEKAKSKNGTNKAHNKHLNHFKAVLSELIQWDIIEVNPFNVKNLPLLLLLMQTTPQALKICRRLKGIRNNHYNFRVFCITIFLHTSRGDT